MTDVMAPETIETINPNLEANTIHEDSELREVTLDLRDRLDTMLWFDKMHLQKRDNEGYSVEAENEFVADTYRAIHEYARTAPFVKNSAEEGPDTTYHASISYDTTQRIQSWLMKGKNPFTELGLVSVDELRKQTPRDHDSELDTKDQATFLTAIGFEATALDTPVPKIEAKSSRRSIVDILRGKAADIKETALDGTERVRQMGRRILDLTPDFAPVEKNIPLWRRKTVRAIAAVSLLAMSIQGSATYHDEAEASPSRGDRQAHVVELPTASIDHIDTTIAAPEVAAPAEDQTSVPDNAELAPVILTMPEDTTVWDQLELLETGDTNADGNLPVQQAILAALPVISADNGGIDLNNVPAGQQIEFSKQALDILNLTD